MCGWLDNYVSNASLEFFSDIYLLRSTRQVQGRASTKLVLLVGGLGYSEGRRTAKPYFMIYHPCAYSGVARKAYSHETPGTR
jgi:hypothetical protein